jgi:hypothetical protein
MKVVEPYAAEYGLDSVVLKDMIHYEYLSDEVSGPEEETGESFEVWRVGMAALADFCQLPRPRWSASRFLRSSYQIGAPIR